ncbi:hypothetical protein [Cohnella zeiphila]|uniref:Uncharacterized protein n=1 Tax=Cohnella zeiphila TaxID=2761120 RepID=A0A7X0ST53_9BACL|nr:hypothetical protein [Cohnella zeiphila]MBB6735521.1 hypothetical protein [Cohnella zeiphila]
MTKKSKELRDLKTEQMGVTNQHETRTAKEPAQIDPPKASPGPYTESFLEDNE